MKASQADETSGLNANLITGNHRAAEASLFDLRQVSRRTCRQEQSCSLGHGLQEKHPGHERVAWEVPLKVRFIRCDVLQRDDSLPGGNFQDSVDEPEREAVR